MLLCVPGISEIESNIFILHIYWPIPQFVNGHESSYIGMLRTPSRSDVRFQIRRLQYTIPGEYNDK